MFGLAVISIWYSVVVYSVHSGSKFFLFWDAAGLICALLGAAVLMKLFNKFPSAINKTLLILLIIGLLVFFAIIGIILGKYKSKGGKNLDYIIVPGAQIRADGPSTVLRYRLEEAALYLKENPTTLCVVSGGKGSNEPVTEARGMADFLIKLGISEDRILLEENSTNTAENMQFSLKLIPENAKIGIVTNNFHVSRALYLAKRFGKPDAEGIAAKSTPLYAPNNVVREVFGLIKDFLIR